MIRKDISTVTAEFILELEEIYEATTDEVIRSKIQEQVASLWSFIDDVNN